MTEIEMLRKKVFYYLAEIEVVCPVCQKRNFIHSKMNFFECERCHKSVRAYSRSYNNNDIERLIENDNDVIRLNRAIKFLHRYHRMNEREKQKEEKRFLNMN